MARLEAPRHSVPISLFLRCLCGLPSLALTRWLSPAASSFAFIEILPLLSAECSSLTPRSAPEGLVGGQGRREQEWARTGCRLHGVPTPGAPSQVRTQDGTAIPELSASPPWNNAN